MRRLDGAAALLTAVASVASPEDMAGVGVFEIDPGASELTVHVGKAGLFGFAGHEHDLTARRLAGRVVVNLAEPARSTVSLRVESRGLVVTGGTGPAGDIPKVQETLSGPRVLDVGRFPEIAFDSTAVEARRAPDGTWDTVITGDLRIRDVTRPVHLPMRVEARAGSILVTGRTTVRQTDFGIRPVSVGAVIRVKDEVEIAWRMLGRSP
jgi:polyisoprenoid-binding protein YceI